MRGILTCILQLKFPALSAVNFHKYHGTSASACDMQTEDDTDFSAVFSY